MFPGANLAPKPGLPADEPEILDSEEEGYIAQAQAEIVSEPVADPPIVEAEPVLADEQPTSEQTPKGARKRKTASTRAPRATKTARTAKPRARKSTRPTPDS